MIRLIHSARGPIAPTPKRRRPRRSEKLARAIARLEFLERVDPSVTQVVVDLLDGLCDERADWTDAS